MAAPEAEKKDVKDSKFSNNCTQFVASDSKPKVVSLEVKDFTFASALGDNLELNSIPVVNTYKGEISLDCDGVTNLAASMILAQNLQARLETGQVLSGGKFGNYDALHIMSKKLLNKPYDFQMKLENMKVGKLLGKGSFAQVWSAVYFGSPFALKQINPSKVRTAKIYRERDMLIFLKNPRICGIFGAWYQNHCFFLLEQCIGNLAALNLKLAERQRFFLCIDLLEGLEYIHSKNIIHCNVVPENCLVKPGIRLCIGGFGHANTLPNNAVAVNAKKNLGVFGYQEAITNMHFIYSQHSDVFSAACVIFELTTQRYLLRYSSSTFAAPIDYITAFEIGRRTGVKKTADLENDQFPREKLEDRVNKSPLGQMLSRMITVPWTERISAGMAKLQADITTTRLNYEKIIDLDDKELPVGEDERVSFVPPTGLTPDDAKSWDMKALACLYYDAEDKDARKRIRPICEQAADSDSDEESFCNRIPPSGVVRKDLRRDKIDVAEKNESGINNEHLGPLNETALDYQLDSKSVVTTKNVEDAANAAVAKAMKEIAPAMIKEIFETEMVSLRKLLARGNQKEVSETIATTNNRDEAAKMANDDEEADVHSTVFSNGKPKQKEDKAEVEKERKAEDGAEENADEEEGEDEGEDEGEEEDEEEKHKERKEDDDEDEELEEKEKAHDIDNRSSSESDDGDWPASSRKIIPTQRDSEGFLKPLKSSRKHKKGPSSRPHSCKQKALDEGQASKSFKHDRDAAKLFSKHSQSGKKEKRQSSYGDCRNESARSSHKLSSASNVDTKFLMHSNKDKKFVPASRVKISGLQKRLHPPSPSSMTAKKARRNEEDTTTKVVYTHGCSYCPGKFASKQEAAEHQRFCKVRIEIKKKLGK